MTGELQNCPPRAAADKSRYSCDLPYQVCSPLPPLAAALGREFSALEPDYRPQSGTNESPFSQTDYSTRFLNTLLVSEAHARILSDARLLGTANDHNAVDAGPDGFGPTAYADAVATYLGFAVSRTSDYCSTICTWANNPQMEIVRGTFARQALPMTWDFAEANVFGPSTGSLEILLDWIVKVTQTLPAFDVACRVHQLNATSIPSPLKFLITTDPPYYDNIGYADLSDFFYIWLRRSLSRLYPDLFSTLLVPKEPELVASQFRHGGNRDEAKGAFEKGLTLVFDRMRELQIPEHPMAVFYAFKQAESEGDEENDTQVASTGWETMLEALRRSGFWITGTWPVRTERSGRSVSVGTNALASSVVLACRVLSEDAPMATRREFIAALRKELGSTSQPSTRQYRAR